MTVPSQSHVWSSDRGDFWAKPVQILVIARSTGYMLTSSGFILLNWGILNNFLLNLLVIFLQSWTSTDYFSNSTGSSVTNYSTGFPLSLVWSGPSGGRQPYLPLVTCVPRGPSLGPQPWQGQLPTSIPAVHLPGAHPWPRCTLPLVPCVKEI